MLEPPLYLSSPAAARSRPRSPARARPWFGLPARAAAALGELILAVRLALPAYVVSRLALFAAAWVAVAAFGNARRYDPQYPAPFQTWLSWDAAHYMRIAASGYPASPHAADSGYFPLLPAALHLAGGGPVAALCLSFALGLGGVAVLTGLTRALMGEEAARRTAWIACWWPEAFVLSAVYTEGPFLLLTAGATWAAWRRRPLVAALLAAAAALLRPTGLLLAVPLLALLPAGRGRLAALAPVAAAAAFAAYLWVHTGTPLAFLISQSSNHPVHPGTFALAGLERRRPEEYLGLGCLLVAALLAFRLARMRQLGRWRLGALLLVAVFLLPPLTSGTLASFGRYAAVAFPLYWPASTLRLGRLAPAAVPAALVVAMACGMGRVTP